MTASRAGRRVAVLDVPLSQLDVGPERDPDRRMGRSRSSVRLPDVSDRTARRNHSPSSGRTPYQGTCDATRRTGADYEQFVGRLVQGASLKGRLTRTLLGRGGWDLFVQVFTEAHCAGHQCWHIHDAEHPSHDAGLAAEIGDPLLRVYRAIDAALGDIIGEAGDALVIVVVAHGMAHQYGAQLLLPEILFRLGAAARPTWLDAQPELGRTADLAHVAGSTHASDSNLPGGEFAPAAPADELPRLSADPERSLCFPVANGLSRWGHSLESHRARAGGPARTWGSDRPLLRPTRRRPDSARTIPTPGGHSSAEYHERPSSTMGPLLARLPDLLVEWSDEGPLANTVIGPADEAMVRATSRKSGLVEAANEWGRTGEHRPDGLIASAGPGSRAGPLGEVDLVDIAPTILRLLGVDCSVDGKPIPEIVAAG